MIRKFRRAAFSKRNRRRRVNRSKLYKHYEAECKVSLTSGKFDLTPRGCILTRFGRLLSGHVRDILRSLRTPRALLFIISRSDDVESDRIDEILSVFYIDILRLYRAKKNFYRIRRAMSKERTFGIVIQNSYLYFHNCYCLLSKYFRSFSNVDALNRLFRSPILE